MTIPAWVTQLFQHVDNKDAAGFAACLTQEGVFRYGSQSPVHGRAAVEAYVHGFFARLAGLRHSLTGFWWGEAERVCFVAGEVRYELADGRQVAVPFLNQLHMDGALIERYLVYTDPTPMMAPA
jgi:ketosteroid isomerase-like protein